MWVGTAVLTVFIITSAIWVVTLKNLFRAALSLGLVLIGVAVVFLSLGAEFLAFVQILVYVGAILTLIVFAVMLTSKLQTSEEPASRGRFPAAAASAATFALLTWATASVPWRSLPETAAPDLAQLGQQLVTNWVLPFEVISLVFVAVVVGAIAIAAPHSSEKAPRS